MSDIIDHAAEAADRISEARDLLSNLKGDKTAELAMDHLTTILETVKRLCRPAVDVLRDRLLEAGREQGLTQDLMSSLAGVYALAGEALGTPTIHGDAEHARAEWKLRNRDGEFNIAVTARTNGHWSSYSNVRGSFRSNPELPMIRVIREMQNHAWHIANAHRISENADSAFVIDLSSDTCGKRRSIAGHQNGEELRDQLKLDGVDASRDQILLVIPDGAYPSPSFLNGLLGPTLLNRFGNDPEAMGRDVLLHADADTMIRFDRWLREAVVRNANILP